MNEKDAKLIKSLPSMLWTRTIIHRAGCTLAQIHREFAPGYSSSHADGSRRLYKNHRGVPVKDPKLIDWVENKLPGTKRVLFHPLWDILKNPDATTDELIHYMDKLDLNLKGKLFDVDPHTQISVRKKADSYAKIYYVSKESSLDALACLLIFIRESEIAKQVQAYIISKWEAVFLIYRLSMIYPYSDIMPFLNQLVSKLFIKKNHPLPIGYTDELWDSFPFDREPPTYIPIYIVQNIYSGVLWNAEVKKVVSNDPQEQLNFLFWVDHFFNKNEIKEALIKLPSDFDVSQSSSHFPPPLDDLMERIRGDSRRYILRMGKFFF